MGFFSPFNSCILGPDNDLTVISGPGIDLTVISGSGIDLTAILGAVGLRSTRKIEDETICLTTLLGGDSGNLLNLAPASRMHNLLRSVGPFFNSGIHPGA